MESITFTPAEAKLLLAIIKHNQAAVQPDWEAVAKECGYSTTAAANACWSRVKKNKLSAESTGHSTGGIDKSKRKKAAPKAKKAGEVDEKAGEAENDIGGDDAPLKYLGKAIKEEQKESV